MKELKSVLAAYGIDSDNSIIETISSGLINPTWKITPGEDQFILQRINTTIFHEPEKLAINIRLLADYSAQHHPEYLFVSPIQSTDGSEIVTHQNSVYRLFPFVKNSHTIISVATSSQAYEAAFQFGKFTSVFSQFNATTLHSTIPDFHNLSFRFLQFKYALQKGNPARIKECTTEIKQINDYLYLVDWYEQIKTDSKFKLRVTHHDTKISNVLFDSSDKGICVIDLDTVMPGYFISDVGDMLRTYLSPTTEEENDLSKIYIRKEFFEAIVNGYLTGMDGRLTEVERGSIFFAGLFLIYMQAMRFLTDYLLNDVYYGSTYQGQNLIRTRNQLYLLKMLLQQESDLKQFVSK